MQFAGKTTVIVGLIKHLIQRGLRMMNAPAAPGTQVGGAGGWRRANVLKNLATESRHILVCAASNAAVDEIAGRLIAAHTRTSEFAIPATNQHPLVRLGSNIVPSSPSFLISLDQLVGNSKVWHCLIATCVLFLVHDIFSGG